jgi:hypothetical protein
MASASGQRVSTRSYVGQAGLRNLKINERSNCDIPKLGSALQRTKLS